MNRHYFVKIILTGCILALLAGCGTTPRPENAGTGQEGSSDSYITVAEAKAAVLANVGLSEEDVRFVRFHLEPADDDSRYDIEFISENAEYDYVVNAVTGKILSMNCEIGSYNIASVPPEIMPPADIPTANMPPAATQPAASMPTDTPPVSAGPTDTPPASAGSTDAPLTNTPAASTKPTAAPPAATQPAASIPTNAPAEAAQQYIGADAAKQAALYHAGLDAAAVRFTHAHLEWEHGCWTYDVEFHKDNTEYDYSINALTGEILSHSHDTEYHHHHGSAVPAGSEMIAETTAKQIALEYAGVAEADAQRLEVEFDYDDGRAEYEVEWHVGQLEYSCDVDAYTGEILSFKKELD